MSDIDQAGETEGFVDIHSHILPRADDGSRYWGETKNLLELSYGEGFRKIFVTPHYVHHHNRMQAEFILEDIEKLKELAGTIAPDLEIYPGQELFYFEGAVEALESGRVLTLAGTNYVLVEFSPRISYGELFQAVRALRLACYLPVLAHVERYVCLRPAGRIEELIQMGACMQMNYRSLSDPCRLAERNWCRKIVLSGKIHFLGTDMHRLDYRPPETGKTVRWFQKRGGRECLDRLARRNPLRLLEGRPL